MMNTDLLKSKVHIPILPQDTLSRSQLQLDIESAVPRHKLILVSAPAGYGKTTLLADWAHTTRFPVAWLSLGNDDNEVVRFLRYLLAAWEVVQPEVVDTPLGVLLASLSPDTQAVVAAFLRAAEQAPPDLTFVLDDFHWIVDPAILEALTLFVDHIPPQIHFILAGRGEPPLPLARYRARRELVEFRADDLRFSEQESRQFLNELLGMVLSSDKIAALYQQTEGWITGLHLAVLTLRRGYPAAAGRPLASGSQRFIADYLAGEVLQQLPADLQEFLLKTSILDRLCGSLCDAVTERAGGQAALETLERENLFLIPLDNEREWFRYHTLFAEFLQSELQRRLPDLIQPLHQQAASWYLAHDLPDPAFQHAVAGSSVELVIKIFNDYVNAKLLSGELKRLEGWITALSAEWINTYPVLNLMQAGYLAYTGAVEACVRCIDDIEQRLTPVVSEHQRWQMARVTAVRCLMACEQNNLPLAFSFAQRALDELPEDDLGFRPGIYAALGDTYRQNGNWDDARNCYLKVLSFPQSPPVRVRSAHTYGALADLSLRQGQLRDAERYWQKALTVIKEQGIWSSCELPVIGWVSIRMGEILYEWDQQELAGDYVARGLERAEMGGDVRALIAGYLAAGRLKLSEGDSVGAADFLERARPLVEQASFTDWTSRFERLQLDVWLVQDRIGEAVRWAKAVQQAAIEGHSEREVAGLAAARVLIMKHDSAALKQAQMLLGPLLAKAEAEGRMAVTIEALVLKALLEWTLGNQPAAMTALEQALRLAEPEGYVHLFADLGLPMARLLQEARSRAVMPDYVSRLLAAFRIDQLPHLESGLPEPLTAREQQIVGLIAAGLTNQEIASQLVISAETVKKHIGSIFGKLGVNNRTQAVAKARALNLLES